MKELLFVQPQKRSWSTGQNNNPAVRHALQSPQKRASIKASCPALIFWTGLARIPSARSAWQCHPTWICAPVGRKETCELWLDTFLLFPHIDLFLTSSVMHPQSPCPILSLISLFITLCHTHTHIHTHSCTSPADDNVGPVIAHGTKREYVCVMPQRSNGS